MRKRKAYACAIRLTAYQVREAEGPAVRSGADVAAAFQECGQADREMFFTVTLSQKNEIIDRHLVSIGTLTASLVHPREALRPALTDSAAAVIFVHNHPSGDPTPSQEDRVLTQRLKEAGELLGIRVVDHVVIGRGRHTSFVEAGLL